MENMSARDQVAREEAAMALGCKQARRSLPLLNSFQHGESLVSDETLGGVGELVNLGEDSIIDGGDGELASAELQFRTLRVLALLLVKLCSLHAGPDQAIGGRGNGLQLAMI